MDAVGGAPLQEADEEGREKIRLFDRLLDPTLPVVPETPVELLFQKSPGERLLCCAQHISRYVAPGFMFCARVRAGESQ
jgi:hypothetical protein